MNENPASPSVIPVWTTRQVVVGTLFVIAVLLAFWLLYQFRLVVFILFIAIVLGTAIRPAVDWLHRRNIPRPAGVIVIYLLLLVLIAGFVLLVAPLLAEQLTQISLELPGQYNDFRNALIQSRSIFLQQIGLRLPIRPFLPAPAAPAGQGEAQVEAALDRVAMFFSVAGITLRGLLALLAIFLLAFYWTLESNRTIRSLLLFFDPVRRERIRALIAEIESRVGGYIRGQSLLCLIIAAVSLIAYLLIGLPYALVLALIAGVMEAVPMVGPILGAIPAILVGLTQAPERVVWVVVATAGIQALEGYLLVPRVMKGSVGVSPIVSLLALATFASLLGLPGALLAIPVAAIIQLILDRFVLNVENPEEPDLGGRDQASLLRYEAHDLALDVRKQVRQKEVLAEESADRVEDSIEAIIGDLDQLLAQIAENRNAP
jgi:predicted PurR-regulated permease PerM